MAAQETDAEAFASDAPPRLPNIWLPELVERYASFLHPNEVMCTLRCADKATAEQFRGHPEFASVRLSQPVPPHAFAARWAAPGAVRDLTLAQRKQLLRLTAATGVVANLEVALEAVGFIPNVKQLQPLLEAAAAAGHVDAIRRLVGIGHNLAPGLVPETGHSPGAAVKSGNVVVCDACGLGAQRQWSVGHVAAALHAGRPEVADCLLQQQPEGPIGPSDSLAPLGGKACKRLLDAAAEGCNLATLRECNLEVLQWLRQHGCPINAAEVVSAAAECVHLPVLAWAVEEMGVSLQNQVLARGAVRQCNLEALQWLRQYGCPLNAAEVVLAAARAHNMPVLTWAVEELGAQATSPALMDAMAALGRVELLTWLHQHGCPWGAITFWSAAAVGCEAALEWLVEQGCPLPDDGGPYLVAARNGDLATLRCLARLGCPWGPTSGRRSVFESCLHPCCLLLPVLRLLVNLGCPVKWEAYLAVSHISTWGGPKEVGEWLAAEADQRQQKP
ncbi:hypothetical protein GPECTOR_13g612 [Gonium pectorale]|uniref:Ankyrin repeat domain-containing protein n=1 Tax=Gonium pectorale TaxID=33097 RepID=A0A150GMX2_GONPE|nr:hypothetical protein GPECTOR_13g612 [Gonium pectorale]|eukprot:KXZ51125.1 hypothetical protein GPECTOR_13g612 [Gonium pectorale]